MATDVRTRYGPSITSWRGYDGDCREVSAVRSSQAVLDQEYVESYRGKHQYIDVGGKRVRKYHPYTRYKVKANQAEDYWCSAPDNNFWGQNTIWLVLKGQELQPEHEIFLGKFPPVTQTPLAELGLMYRSFAERDLYSKLNEPRFNSAVLLAELAETVYGVRDLLFGAVKMLYKAGETGRLITRFVANPNEMWLWYRYALMPAILSANDLIAALKEQQEVNRVQSGLRKKINLSGTDRKSVV